MTVSGLETGDLATLRIITIIIWVGCIFLSNTQNAIAQMICSVAFRKSFQNESICHIALVGFLKKFVFFVFHNWQ